MLTNYRNGLKKVMLDEQEVCILSYRKHQFMACKKKVLGSNF